MNKELLEKFKSFITTFERHYELGFNFEIERGDVELLKSIISEIDEPKEEE